ncbi:MAG: Cysteine--tRNA ligase [Dehalococcoidia bacterium]|nr:Cysteine--tRNA ligase [Chloroflexota bacterium]
MSLKYLGNTLDIHGGGQDLIFPHHENEIAQSEAFTGVVPFVRYWMHNGLLQLGQDKMSKSLGNLITVRELLQRFSTDGFRLFVLSSYYRSPLTYSDEGLEAMERGVERLRRAARVKGYGIRDMGYGIIPNPYPLTPNPYRQRFVEAMDDDFNTAQAVAILFDLAREINRAREEGAAITEAQKTFRELAGVLGLQLKEEDRGFAAEPFVELLVNVRAELRAAKQWHLADMIRARLGALGVTLEDTPGGSRFKVQRLGTTQPRTVNSELRRRDEDSR